MTKNENARLPPGADTSNSYAAKDSALSQLRQFLRWRGKCWLCQKLCRDEFFNIDASREIDRLTLKLEKLRAGGLR